MTPCDLTGPGNVECRALLDGSRQERVPHIDELKIDVEGNEDTILIPFFSEANESLWPKLIIIEDARDAWRSDLFSILAKRGYTIAARTKLNVMMRR